MATQANPWDADPVVSTGKNPWDSDPVVASPAAPARASNPRLDKITSYASETDRLLGLTPGTSLAQLTQESRLRDDATSPVGAEGVAQVMPTTKANLEKRLGRPLNSRNTDDALLIHREVMKENMQKFGNRDDALRGYNGGWDKNRWSNPETASYVDKINGRMGIPAAEGSAYKPFSTVRKNIDEKTLNTDQDWLKASGLIYELLEGKAYGGKSQSDLAEYGKDKIGYFNFNTIDMGRYAYKVSQQGSQEQKEAFLYMLDTYDETDISWAGAGRAAKGIFTDATNAIGIVIPGVGLGAKLLARQAAKEAAKQVVKQSMLQSVKGALVTGALRTGVVAGMEGAIFGAAESTIKQGVEVSAGRRDGISVGKTALDTAAGAAGGVVLGTGLDVVASKALPPAARAISNIREMFRGTPKEAPKVTAPSVSGVVPEVPVGATTMAPEAPTGVAGVTPQVEAKVASEAAQELPSGELVLADGVVPNAALTPDEILAARARQQDGRLPADEIAPDMSGRTGTEPLITMPDIENTGGRTTRVNGEPVAKVTKADVEELAKPIITQMRDKSNDELKIVLEDFRTGRWTDEEKRVITSAMRIYAGDLKEEAAQAIVTRDALLGKVKNGTITPAEELKLQEVTLRAEELIDRAAHPIMGDDSAGSMASVMLSDRRNGGAGTNKITVESIMEEKGLSREEALSVWAEVQLKAEQEAAVQKVMDEYEVKIRAADEAGDTELAVRLAVQKGRERAAMVEQVAPGSAGFFDKTKELAISDVFSTTTVQINFVSSAIQTLVTPALKFAFGDSFGRAARVELATAYTTMGTSLRGAYGGMNLSYRLEQSILTRDGGKLTEGELALTGLKAGIIRFFPRILNASDEFLSRLNWDMFVASTAANKAVLEGSDKGLKGKDLVDFYKNATAEALKASRAIENGDDLIQPLINKGVNRGYTGDELWDWIEKEAMRYPDALRKGNDEEALKAVRDILYKRKFSGDNWASTLAQKYEDMNKSAPWLSLLVGQLFFRTPVRIFEMGVRLTPGLQIIAPGFISDLQGKNGTLRQIRAQAESMTSIALGGAVLSLYSQGRLTGDQDIDTYQQQRVATDGGNKPPYSLKMSDGSWWSYKLFDPISTPVKIMINALERVDKLQMKRAQGEDIPDSKIEEAFSHMYVGISAVMVAIKDANLVSGAKMTGELLANVEDIEKNSDKFLKFLGEKMFLLVPNTLHKIARDNDPGIRDPADFWQMVNEKLARPLGLEGSAGILTSKSYDYFGNVRRPADTGALWNMFATTSPEELARGLNPKELAVAAEMTQLTKTTGATFKTPIKHPSLGDLDLRTVMAKDGKRTLYDVWQNNYKALKPEEPLYELATSDLPTGTYKNRGIKAEAIQALVGKFQEAAFAQLRVEEGDTINAQIDKVLRARALSKSGAFDSKLPY